MDKQRLLELAGIMEASHISQHRGYVAIFINHNDVGQIGGVWGPFSTEDEAWRFLGEFEEYLTDEGNDEMDDESFDVFELGDPNNFRD